MTQHEHCQSEEAAPPRRAERPRPRLHAKAPRRRALTASALGKEIGRSSGAVANCLARLAKAKKLRQAKRKPRAYALTETKSK